MSAVEPAPATPERDPISAARVAPVAFVPRRRRRRWRWWLLAALIAVAGAGVWRWRSGRGAESARKFKAAKVDRGAIEESVTATGTVQAVETVQVGALVSGRVLELRADENDEVKQGQVIAVIDPEPYRARVEQAKAQLAIADAAVEKARVERARSERDRDRVAQLGTQGVAGRAEVEEAESAVELGRANEKSAAAQAQSARAALRAAQLDADRTTIVSPIDGIVLSRAVEVGQSVTAGFQTPTLFTIARDLGEMEVRAAIDEADIGKVKEGLSARFTVDAHGERAFEGKIAAIRRSPTVAQNVVTYEALIRVGNADRGLWPGMTATVKVVTARKEDVLRLPAAALRFKPPKDLAGPPLKGGKRRLFKLVGGKAVPVEAKLGIGDDEHAEIVEGEVAAGDDVITEIEGDAAKPAQGGANQRGGGMRGMRF